MINRGRDGAVTDARTVIGGVSWKPYLAIEAEKILSGKPLTKATAEIAARPAIRDFEPLSKNAYKVPIVKALL